MLSALYCLDLWMPIFLLPGSRLIFGIFAFFLQTLDIGVPVAQDFPWGIGTVMKVIILPFIYLDSLASFPGSGLCINESWHALPPEFKENEYYTDSVQGGGEHPKQLSKQLLNLGIVPQIL